MSFPPAHWLGSSSLSSSYGWTSTPAALFLSAVTLAEIEDGIAKLRREGATRKSEDLKELVPKPSCISMVIASSRSIPGHGTDRRRLVWQTEARGQGRSTGISRHRHRGDGFVATPWIDDPRLSRNVRHFAPLGIPTLDPFACCHPPRRVDVAGDARILLASRTLGSFTCEPQAAL